MVGTYNCYTHAHFSYFFSLLRFIRTPPAHAHTTTLRTVHYTHHFTISRLHPAPLHGSFILHARSLACTPHLVYSGLVLPLCVCTMRVWFSIPTVRSLLFCAHYYITLCVCLFAHSWLVGVCAAHHLEQRLPRFCSATTIFSHGFWFIPSSLYKTPLPATAPFLLPHTTTAAVHTCRYVSHTARTPSFTCFSNTAVLFSYLT